MARAVRAGTPAAGIIPNLIDRLAVFNHIMFPSMVVKRCAYEQLGGIHPELFHSADWAMWKRIAAQFPVWYEPEPLIADLPEQAFDGKNLPYAPNEWSAAAGGLPVRFRPRRAFK